VIRLFVSDIDGCLSEPYRPIDLDHIQELRRIAENGDPSGVPDAPPELCLLTGRAYGYAEAISQVLHVRGAVLFEAEAGLFDPLRARVHWHPGFTENVESELDGVRKWLHHIARRTGLLLDIGKRTQAGIVGPDEESIRRTLPEVEAHVAVNHPDFRVAHTSVSIDVLHRNLTKLEGLHWLNARTEVSVQEMAYIGDSMADLEALRVVGRSFAPSNALPEILAAVQTPTGPVARGVLEAYRTVISENAA
jgi:hydroxymethylpyrimidine pyrophosphatase-like HAD family hydrolase